MPDTHDADESSVRPVRRPLPDRANHIADGLADIVRELRAEGAGTSDQRLRLAAVTVSLRMLGDDVRDQLAAVTARAKAAARLAELGEPETELRIIGVSGLAYAPTERDLECRAQWLPGVRLEERQVYPTPWRAASDAAPTNQPNEREQP